MENTLYFAVNQGTVITSPLFQSEGTLLSGSCSLCLMRDNDRTFWNGSAWVGGTRWLVGTAAPLAGIYYYRWTGTAASSYTAVWRLGTNYSSQKIVLTDPLLSSANGTTLANNVVGSVNTYTLNVGTATIIPQAVGSVNTFFSGFETGTTIPQITGSVNTHTDSIVLGTHQPEIETYINTAIHNIAGTGLYAVTCVVKSSNNTPIANATVSAIPSGGYWAGVGCTDAAGTTKLYLQAQTYTFVSWQNGIMRDSKDVQITGPTTVNLLGVLNDMPIGSSPLPLVKIYGTMYQANGQPAGGDITFTLYSPSRAAGLYLCLVGSETYYALPNYTVSATVGTSGYWEAYVVPNNLISSPNDSLYQINMVAITGNRAGTILNKLVRIVGTASGTYAFTEIIGDQ